jgi:benzoylformate decarboxylase
MTDETGRTVRDAAFDVLRRLDLTTMFANPGSTEVSLLAGLPEDLRFVLALHEGSVIGMAAGYALGRGKPALALVHSMPGLGNAVAAIATARNNRAPLVVIVGQQDRRHLALDPFLAGRLDGLAGNYPVWTDQPIRAQDVPGAIVRAYHEAETHRGPAIVIVPMDDWLAPAPDEHEIFGPARVLRSTAADPAAVDELAAFLADARNPVLVAGAGNDTPEGWAALVALADKLGAPVWQEPFGAQAGFPQDHPRFAGHLSSARTRLRATLADHDAVLVVGTTVLRQYPYDEGPLFNEGTRVAVISQDPEEVHRSPADLAVFGDPPATVAALADAIDQREAGAGSGPPPPPAVPAGDGGLTAGQALAALGARLPRDTVIVEESPTSRLQINAHIPARESLGFVSATGLLGFGMPASIGLRMALAPRPVVAIIGDGASLYQIQSVWSAQRYHVGTIFVVMVNGGYAIMDRLAERHGKAGPWPAVDDVDVGGLARSLGCDTMRVGDHDALQAALDELTEGLAERQSPLLLEIVVEQDRAFNP